MQATYKSYFANYGTMGESILDCTGELLMYEGNYRTNLGDYDCSNDGCDIFKPGIGTTKLPNNAEQTPTTPRTNELTALKP